MAGHDAATTPLGVKRAVGYCPDVGGLVPRATPWEHLQLSARLRRMDEWEDRARDLLERFELGDVAHRVIAGFSHGMSRRLCVVLAALHEPFVLLLDEPFDGVDPLGVEATLDVSPTPAPAAPACWSPPTCASSRSRPAAPPSCCAAATASRAMAAADLTGEGAPTAPSSTELPGPVAARSARGRRRPPPGGSAPRPYAGAPWPAGRC